MGIAQHDVVGECVLVPPVWRVGVFVVIQVVVVVLVVAGYDVETALACAAGGGLAAAHVAGRPFARRARPGRRDDATEGRPWPPAAPARPEPESW